MRARLRQPGPADHGRWQLGAVADQGGGQRPGAPAHAAVQPDAAAQDQGAAAAASPSAGQRRRRHAAPVR